MRVSLSAVGVLIVLLCSGTAFAEDRIVSSEDGTIHASLPEGWVKSDSNKKKNRLQVKDPENDYFLLFLADSKADIDTNLKDYAKGRLDHILGTLKDGSATDAKSTKVGEDNAIQYEITGTLKETGLRLKYLLTIVETKKSYYQCMGWCIASKFAMAKPELEKVTQGLTEKAE